MKQLVRFPSGDDQAEGIVVEVDLAEAGLARAARPGEIAAEAGRSLEAALEVIRPTAGAIIAKVDSLGTKPTEVTVKFGIRLTVQAGAIIASTGGEGHFEVTLTWKRS